MDGQNVVVAVFTSVAEAERARDRLIEIGIPATDIRMSSGEAAYRAGLAETDTPAAPQREGFWDWLFGRDVPAYDRPWYETNLREGRTVLSVLVRDNEERHRVAEILEDFSPIDFEETESRYRGIETPAVADSSLASSQIREPQGEIAGSTAAASPGEPLAERVGTGDTVIPVIKEDIAVGKRVHERRYRIRSYTIETPVERDVTLRDERVVIERRPVPDQVAMARAGSQMPQNREYEVIERHEEPIVEKRQVAEEVVVRKEAEERTERVRDTVRETKVDVEGDAGSADNRERSVPGNTALRSPS
jgi:methyl coenzyme M reductase subunit D